MTSPVIGRTIRISRSKCRKPACRSATASRFTTSPTKRRLAIAHRSSDRTAAIVTAYLVVPPGKGPFPAVIYGHWCMPGSEKENRKEFLDEAVVLAHSGVISLLPDNVIVHPGFVEDKSPLNEQQVAVDVQQDINLRRGADLLLARDDVDPKRLAYVGHSCDALCGRVPQRHR